jgi:hypothetical protein
MSGLLSQPLVTEAKSPNHRAAVPVSKTNSKVNKAKNLYTTRKTSKAITTAQVISPPDVIVSRRAPQLNGGRVEGSIRVLNGEPLNLNNGATITGDLLVPGTPNVVSNGSNNLMGVMAGSGNTAPAGYPINLNGNVTLRFIVTQTDPIVLATVAAPALPTATMDLSLNPGQTVSDFSKVRNLTLNTNYGNLTLPPGNYGQIIANSNSTLVLGVTGTNTSYQLQNLTLNDNTQLQVQGNVTLTIANGLNLASNTFLGTTNNPTALTLNIAAGSVNANNNSNISALVNAPQSMVSINSGVKVQGRLIADQVIVNGADALIQGQDNAGNQAPQVNVGIDQMVTLPNNIMLNAVVVDDGRPNNSFTVKWSKVSGPGTVTFSHPDAVITTANFSLPGTYVLELTADDSVLSGSDTLTVIVNEAVNEPPRVMAPADQTLTLPASATLNGVVSDDGRPAGKPLTIAWSAVSGPGTVTFSQPTSATTLASFSAAGSYVLRLTASDTAATTSDDVTITVNSPVVNQPPMVMAGADQTVILPNTIMLQGVATDDGGAEKLQYQWTQVGGPDTVTFNTPLRPATEVLVPRTGSYFLRLTVSDGQLMRSDDVTVNAVQLQPVLVDSLVEDFEPTSQTVTAGEKVLALRNQSQQEMLTYVVSYGGQQTMLNVGAGETTLLRLTLTAGSTVVITETNNPTWRSTITIQ